MAHYIPCQPGTTLLYFLDGKLTTEPGVAWVFSNTQKAEEGFHVPNLVGAFGSERHNEKGAAVLMPDGMIYTSHTVYENLEAFVAHMDPQPTAAAPTAASKPAATPAAPSLWEVKEPSELPPSLAALV